MKKEIKDGFYYYFTEVDKCPTCKEALQPADKRGDAFRYYCSVCKKVIETKKELK